MAAEDCFAFSLGALVGHVPPALVPPAALAPIMALARRVPDLDGGFEVRLHDPDAPVDLSLAAMPPRFDAYAALAGRATRFAVDPSLAATPGWQAASAAAAALLDRRLRDPAAMPLLWLEFDAAALRDTHPQPCLLIQGAPRSTGGAAEGLVEAAARAYASLLRAAPPPAVAELVERLDRLMPPGVTLPTIGVMAGRPGLPLRLRLHGWPVDLLVAALHEAAGRDTADQLREAAALHQRFEPVDGITIDIPAQGRPRIGVPMRCPVGAGLTHPMRDRFDLILDWLVGAGLCRPEAAAGLRRWPGWSWDPRPAPPWPPAPPGAEFAGVLMRIFVQFKLAFDEAGILRAKAYFGLLRRAAPRAAASLAVPASPLASPLADAWRAIA